MSSLEPPDLQTQPYLKQQPPPGISRWTVTRTLVGLLLLFAACMKGYELATGPVTNKDLLTTRWFLVLGVEFELALGLALLAGVLPKVTWSVALLCFSGFTVITAHKVWLGETDCGCFGYARVDPRITLVIDLVVIALLLASHPKNVATAAGLSRLPLVIICTLAIGIPSGWLMATVKTASVTDDGLITAGNFIVLEPEKWVNKPFPLLKHIDIGNKLSTGKWIVALYDRTCSHCAVAMPKYIEIANTLVSQGSNTRLAVIRIDLSETKTWRFPDSVVTGQLDPTREWFAETPVELQLEDGKVIHSVVHGKGLSWWKGDVASPQKTGKFAKNCH